MQNRQVLVEDSLSHGSTTHDNNSPITDYSNTGDVGNETLRREFEHLNLEGDDINNRNNQTVRIIPLGGRNGTINLVGRNNSVGDSNNEENNEDILEDNNNNNIIDETEDRIHQQQNRRLRATETIRLESEAINNLEQIGIPIRREANGNNDDNTENLNDEDFQRLLALCKHNIMSLYYERTSKPHPSISE